jgi:hypothetical protein
MKEWKIKQEIYHRLNTEHDDAAENFDYEISDNIVENAVKYFITTDVGWIWPAKSYMVGICYAKWLSDIYGGDPIIDYLEDPDLLYGNDPYYVNYSTDPATYHNILKQIGGWDFNSSIGVVPQVRHYFDLEFGD